MKIFFTISKTGITQYQKEYNNVLDELKRNKVDFIETIHKTYIDNDPLLKKVDNLPAQENEFRFAHDAAIRKAIFQCDAVIIEATYPSFRLGFEAFFALAQQKPVLVISKEHNYGLLINQPNFFGAKYTDATLSVEVKKFLKHVKDFKLRNRFNLFISDQHKVFLEKEAKHFGLTMSDYIRKLIDTEMNNI